MRAHLLADVVGPCPPLFHPSHQGCHFRPSAEDAVVVGVLLLLLAAIAAVIAIRGGKGNGV